MSSRGVRFPRLAASTQHGHSLWGGQGKPGRGTRGEHKPQTAPKFPFLVACHLKDKGRSSTVCGHLFLYSRIIPSAPPPAAGLPVPRDFSFQGPGREDAQQENLQDDWAHRGKS